MTNWSKTLRYVIFEWSSNRQLDNFHLLYSLRGNKGVGHIISEALLSTDSSSFP